MSKVLEKIKNRIPSFKKRMMEISFDISAQIYEYMKKENNRSQEIGNRKQEIGIRSQG